MSQIENKLNLLGLQVHAYS